MDELKRLVEKMNDNIDTVKSELSEIRVVQTEQAADLKHHIYRTDLAEKRIEMLQSQVNPLTQVHERVKGVFQVLGAVSSGLGLAFGALKAVEYLAKLF